MNKFVFLIHPLDVSYILRKYPWLGVFPDSAVETVFRLVPPFVISHITGVKSPYAEAEGGLSTYP